VYFSFFLFLTCFLSLSNRLAYADCSEGGCPQGQTCVGMGTFKCVLDPKPWCVGYAWTNPGDLRGLPACPGMGKDMPRDGGGISSEAPEPACYADSDCRRGYKCEKGDPSDPKSRRLTTPGDCLRTPPACRVDTECLSDEFCEHRLVNNEKGGVCLPRPLATSN
jgi:hypothetical protein